MFENRKPLPRRQVPISEGQALVELAVTLPILLLLLIGLVSFGRMMIAQIILTQAAWEGARAGATLTDPAAGDSQIIAAVRGALAGLEPERVEIEIDPSQNQPPRNQPFPSPRGYPLTVTLHYSIHLRVPVAIVVPLGASATSRMEYQNP